MRCRATAAQDTTDASARARIDRSFTLGNSQVVTSRLTVNEAAVNYPGCCAAAAQKRDNLGGALDGRTCVALALGINDNPADRVSSTNVINPVNWLCASWDIA